MPLERATQASDLRQLVVDTRARLRRGMLLTGMAAMVCAALTWLLIGASVDMVVPLPTALRVAVCTVFWLLTLTIALTGIAWPAIRRMREEQIALRIEKTIPGMHNRLLTVLDVCAGARADLDASFLARLIEQTRQKLEGYRVEHVVSPRPLRQTTIAAAAVVLVAVAMLAIFNDRMPTAVARMLRPTAPIPPVSWLRLTADPGDVNVLQGESVTVRAVISRGEVDRLSIRLQSADGHWVTYPMMRSRQGEFTFQVNEVNASINYHLIGGGTWTPNHRITMLRRPVVERVDRSVLLPAYTRLTAPQPVDPEAAQISAPVESLVDLSIVASQDTSRGEIQLLKPRTTKAVKVDERETIWFDDDTPPDAVLTGQWRWLSTDVFSGVRAHTFHWGRKPYGFKTRLQQLTISQTQSFFLHIRLDPQEPIGQLGITLNVNDVERTFAWDSERLPLPRERQKKSTYLGQLPEPGKWVRLEITHKDLDASAKANPVRISAISFAVDAGEVMFDRAGTIERQEHEVESTLLEPAGVIALSSAAGKPGMWTGAIPVKEDVHYTVALYNALNHPSLPIKPTAVLAIADQPPVVLIEKPGKSVTLTEPEPLPVMARAFDDYGVWKIGIQTGEAPDKLAEVRWLDDYNAPQRNRVLLTAIDPRAAKLKAGESVYYRMAVADRREQITYSDTFRLGIADVEQAGDDALRTTRNPIRGLLEGLDKLTGVQAAIANIALKLEGNAEEEATPPPGEEEKISPLENPDGTPMTPEQLKELYAAKLDEMDEGPRLLFIDQMKRQMDERNEVLSGLAAQFDEAAVTAAESMTALPFEAQSLSAMSQRMRMMAMDLPPTPAAMDAEPSASLIERLSKMRNLTPAQQDEIARLKKQLEQLTEAQASLMEQPDLAQTQMAKLYTELQAQEAATELGQLTQTLEQQRSNLDAMQRRIAELQLLAHREKSQSAMDAVSREESKLDRQAVEGMRDARQALNALMGPEADELTDAPPPPWTPPGDRADAQAVEADGPDDAAKPDAQAKADGAQPAKPDAAEENWWDKPAPSDDLLPGAKPADRPGDKPQTPRQMLTGHQDRMKQHLSKHSNALSSAQQRTAMLQKNIDDMRDKLEGLGEQNEAPGADVGGPLTAEQALEQLQQLLASKQMQMARGAAGRSLMSGSLEQDDANQPNGGGGGTATRELRIGEVIMTDLGSLDLTADQRAALYRLPPQLRVSLMEGMRERGPEGYQQLIDAYYRQLSRREDLPQR